MQKFGRSGLPSCGRDGPTLISDRNRNNNHGNVIPQSHSESSTEQEQHTERTLKNQVCLFIILCCCVIHWDGVAVSGIC